MLTGLLRCFSELNDGALSASSDQKNSDSQPDLGPINAKSNQDLIQRIVRYGVRRLSGPSFPKSESAPKIDSDFGKNSESAPKIDSASDKNDTALLFLLLCQFRRARNLSSIHALIERLQLFFGSALAAASAKPFDVNQCLSKLRDCKLIHYAEGEMYFISQHVHEVAYKLLSAPLRWSRWEATLDEAWEGLLQVDAKLFFPSDDGAAELKEGETYSHFLRAFWIATAHSLIGRHYYAHLWERSHDAGGFFEYLYHRIASLKYLMLLRTRLALLIAERDGMKQPIALKIPKENELELICLYRFVSDRNDEKPECAPGGESQPQSQKEKPPQQPKDLQDLLDRVDRRRESYIRALLNVLDRERAMILASAPGETWVNWIKQIRENDLKEMIGASTKGAQPSPDKMLYDEALRSDQKAINKTIRRLRERLQLILLDVQGSLYREMGAYAECILSRKAMLTRIRLPAIREMTSRIGDNRPNIRKEIEELNRHWGDASKNKNGDIADLIKTLGKAIESHGSIERLVEFIESAVVDLAASARHFAEPNEKCHEKLLDTFLEINRVCKEDLRMGLQPSKSLELKVTSTSEKADLGASKLKTLEPAARRDADLALQVADLRWRFEQRRFAIDQLVRNRFEMRDCIGRPLTLFMRNGERIEESVNNELNHLNQTEGKIYGAPFRHERDFILQLSQFATLRARLLPLLLRDEAMEESLRLFEEAESGLSLEYPPHLFHRIINQTERAYTLMLIADAAVLRWRFDVGKTGGVLPLDDYRRRVSPSGIAVAGHRLAEAREELLRAERLLGAGRRNVRVWRRLYIAQSQLAVENLLRLLLVLEFEGNTIASEHRFVAEIHEALLYGLEGIRGALDCTVYPETTAVGNSDQMPAEEDELRDAIKLYLSLFIVTRIALRAFTPSSQRGDSSPPPMWPRLVSYGQLASEQSFAERWHSLNQSVGLSRIHVVFGEPPLQQSGRVESTGQMDDEGKWLTWSDFIHLCDEPNAFHDGSSRQIAPLTLREVAIQKINCLVDGLADQIGHMTALKRFMSQRQMIHKR